MSKNKNTDNYNTYKWFEKEIRTAADANEKAIELWNNVKQTFSKFRYWYKDRTLYHYIGFLLSANLVKLDEILANSDVDKKTFNRWVYSKVYEFLEGIKLDKLSYESDQKPLKDTLLLFNVLSVLQLTANPQNRFPFNLYNEIKKGEKWSLEHIHAQQSEDPLQRKDVIKSWMSDILKSIEGVDHITKTDEETGESQDIDLVPFKDKLREMNGLDDIDIEEFHMLRAQIVEAFESPSTKHQLENMALLSCPDNSALNNAIFPVKRDRIIEMERQGKFIPPCTRNVFLKIYSKADNQPFYWSKTDKEEYISEITSVYSTPHF